MDQQRDFIYLITEVHITLVTFICNPNFNKTNLMAGLQAVIAVNTKKHALALISYVWIRPSKTTKADAMEVFFSDTNWKH